VEIVTPIVTEEEIEREVQQQKKVKETLINMKA
jgi:hypothetical protein